MASASPTPTGTAITSYRFDGRDVRVIDRDGQPWFIAVDVALELAHRDAADLTRALDADEKGTHRVRTPGGDQEVLIISEAGLYRAIVQRRASRKVTPEIREGIKRFQRWVFHEVLPQIRKTGFYSAAPASEQAVPRSFAEALRLAADQQEQIAALEVERQQNAPKVEGYDHFVTMRSENIGLRAGMAMVGAYTDKAIKHLRASKVLYGTPATPYKRYRDLGYFTVDPVSDRHDPDKVRPQTHITPKGLDWLRRTLPDHLFRVPPARQASMLNDAAARRQLLN